MELTPTRKKSVMSFLKGALDAADIEIDDLDIHPLLKDLAHNVVKAGEQTAQNALLDRKILEQTERLEQASTITRPKEEETVDQPIILRMVESKTEETVTKPKGVKGEF